MADKFYFVVLILLSYLSVITVNAKENSEINCTDIKVTRLAGWKIKKKLSVRRVPTCIIGYSRIHPLHIWSSIKVNLNLEKFGDSTLYQANSCESLLEARNPSMAKKMLSWIANPDVISSTSFHVSSFGVSCFYIESQQEQNPQPNTTLEFKSIYWTLPMYLIIGLILFLQAETLSRSATFYYSSGIFLGVVFSLLLAVFILHRLVPTKGGAYVLLAGGWSVSLFLLQWTWNNLVDLVLNKNLIVIGYFAAAGCVSFCLCYYYGPVTNERGVNLIRWTIQLIGTYFIYKGVQPESLSLFVVIFVVVVYTVVHSHAHVLQKIFSVLPNKWVSYKVQYYLFPPKTRILTTEEFDNEGISETRRALLQLQQYCTSPDCDAWKVMSRVKNPKRFCTFVTEGLHLTDQEYEDFEENPFEFTRSEDENDEEYH